MPSNLKQAVEEAIKDMVTVEHYKNDNGVYRSIVFLPLLYPSGAQVCIWVKVGSSEESFLIDDGGAGVEQARDCNVNKGEYLKAAKAEGDASGINSHLGVLALLAPKSKLQGAIVTVANASMKAVDRAINTKG